MSVRKVAVSAAFALAAAFGLAGCGSGQHEVIDQGQECSSCHSGGKQVFDDAAPASAVQSNGTVSVKTSAEQVLVCKPIFVSEDGSKFVPEQVSSVKAEDGPGAPLRRHLGALHAGAGLREGPAGHGVIGEHRGR